MKNVIVFAALAAACSSKDKPATLPNPSPNEVLASEMARMIPKLNWCENLPAGIGNNNRNGTPQCDTGDGIIWAGILSSVSTEWFHGDGSLVDFVQGASSAIRDDGKPYRAPSYLQAAQQGHPEDKEFSRDQWLGLCHLAVSYPDKFRPVLRKVYDYAKANGKLCDHPQCLFLPGNTFQGRIALGEGPSDVEIAADEAQVLLEAATTSVGSAQHLVSQDIWLRVRLGMNSVAYRKAADTLARRSPNNLWFQTLSRVTHGKSLWEEYADVVDRLVPCMQQWVSPGLHSTISTDRSGGACEVRPEGAWGTDLVFLGRLLQRTEEFALLGFVEDSQ